MTPTDIPTVAREGILAERGLELYAAHIANTFDDELFELYKEFVVQNFHKVARRVLELEAERELLLAVHDAVVGGVAKMARTTALWNALNAYTEWRER